MEAKVVNKKENNNKEIDMTKEIMAKLDLIHTTITHIDKRLAIVEVNMPTKDILDKTNKEQAESITKAIVDKITISEKSILSEVSEKIDKKLPTWLMAISPVALVIVFIIVAIVGLTSYFVIPSEKIDFNKLLISEFKTDTTANFTKLSTELTTLKVDSKTDFDKVDNRFDKMDSRLDKIENGIDILIKEIQPPKQ